MAPSSRFSPLGMEDDDDHSKRRANSRFHLSFRGRMAFLWACLISLIGWLILERTFLLQAISLSPPPSEALSSPSPPILTPAPLSPPLLLPPSQSSFQATPKLFDIILFNTELDLLELRLNELYHVVDAFVIIEFNLTFSGRPKQLNYLENSRHFGKFKHMIHHIELPPMSAEEAKDDQGGWGIENYTRNKGVEIAIKELQPNDGDWLLLSDLDEIPRPSILLAMKYPEQSSETSSLFLDRSVIEGAWDLFRFGCRFYYYSYEYYGGSWMGPVVMRFRERESHLERTKISGSENAELKRQKEYMVTIGVDDQWTGLGSNMRHSRFKDAAVLVDDACWHCSWCFSRFSEVVGKTQSYSHSEHNQEKYQDREWILDHYRRGVDLFDRVSEKYMIIPRNYDIPDHVRYNRNKYLYMLERYDKPNAGFIDVA
ncbi:hypothetical protein BGZ59_006805 [Podila verticillata]|nr:hypothetical protein BGZ59_006805 [Podila verticillata]